MDQSQQPTSLQLNTEELSGIIPKLKSSHDKAIAVTSAITEIPEGDEEKYQEVENLCVRLKKTYDEVSYPLYKKLADPFKGILDQAREFIAPFDYKSDKNNEYNRLRGLLVAFKQKELDKKKAVEVAAAKKKEQDNKLVDLKTSILKALNNMVTEKIRKAESGSADYFAATKLDTFDKRAEDYMKWKPKLSQEDWEACFIVPTEARVEADWINELMQAEPFDKWNELVISGATPIINAWRAKIPELKQQLIELKKVDDDKEAREKLELEQKRKAQAEALRRQQSIDDNAKKAFQEIDTKAGLDKMENSFVEQATVQQVSDAGPVKLALKFDDPKKALKAFTTILYHCFSHPDFKGIIKTDAKGIQKVDEEGNPIYIDQIQFFVNFFLQKCDADIEGTTVYEKAKIIIKK
jgi:hypothetical protein